PTHARVPRGGMAAVRGQAEVWVLGPAVATPRFEFHARAVSDADPGLASILLLCATGSPLLVLALPGPEVPTPRFECPARAVSDAAPGLASILLLCATGSRLMSLDLPGSMANA